MWLKELKIAVIEKDTDKFQLLLDDIPELSDPKEIEEALYLIKAVKEILYTLKNETQNNMIQIKKNIQFLNSARADKTAKFDITS
jgi:hypothetical protein